ncbi:type II toxin-antitoxin system MqsR family toxin [Loigolactobacillus bifermentans]|uniref:Uncharacterized protein n=1 Tax=Loigolactobacillus bifermentans DSM 20003 TaxID=1423726 RepID=A0A0R1GEH7_9LACO|nr:type II toxin-antitoxin system MqsR family toxin [Loigolactobacillus bifermentans]KRK32622.1 hypothetical protein FC07_GL002052 [Loigolactobacillus bifermentans DSM 20003]QGG60288.1 hypothetical protein LB003_07360 [Loigolactobacillus bifermentans]
MYASQATIQRFLLDFKRAISHQDWEIVQRRASYASVTGMTPAAIRIVLLQLTPADYVAGPERDRNRPGEYVWKFRKYGLTPSYLYIKVKLVAGHAKVLSFHETIDG